MASSKLSSNESKVELNFYLRHSNHVFSWCVPMDCPPSFLLDLKLLKFVFYKRRGILTLFFKIRKILQQFPWVEMVNNKSRENHCVKCIVCLNVKGKDVVLGSKFDMLEKHMEKTKQFITCHIWEKRKGNFM